MAEVVGIVASGIAIGQLSVSILSGAKKLHSTWSKFEDAPKDMEHTLHEVEILAGTLNSCGPIVSQRVQNDAMADNVLKCQELCKKVAREVEGLAAVFPARSSQEEGKRKRFALKWKAYYRRDEIINIRERLHRAVDYLSMAVMFHSMSPMNDASSFHNPPPIGDRQEDSDTRSNEHSHSGDRGNLQLLRTKVLPKRRKDVQMSYWSFGLATYIRQSRGELVVGELEKRDGPTSTEPESKLEDHVVEWKLLPATWLKVGGVCLRWTTQSWGNWQYTLKNFRVLDYGHPGFIACKKGDIQELIHLLSTRTVTLSDVNSDGQSLLHSASYYHQPEMCKWLLQHRAEVDATDNHGMTPLIFCTYTVGKDECRREVTRDTLKVLLEDGLADPTICVLGNPLFGGLNWFNGPSDAFHYFYKALKTSIYEVPDVFLDCTIKWQQGVSFGKYDQRCVRVSFDHYTPLTRERATYVEPMFLSAIVHGIAISLVRSHEELFDQSDALNIFDRVLAFSVSLHPLDCHGATPFDHLCHSTCLPPWALVEKGEHAVNSWLHALDAHGIDLAAYMEEESRLHPDGILIHRYIRLGLVRRFSWKRIEGVEGAISISVWDEEEAAGPAIPGSWPTAYDEKDAGRIIEHPIPIAPWTLEFRPRVCQVVEEPAPVTG